MADIYTRAAQVRKQLGCIPTCAAMGSVTHTQGCPNKTAAVRWIEEPSALVDTEALTKVLRIWRAKSDGYSAIRYEDAIAEIKAALRYKPVLTDEDIQTEIDLRLPAESWSSLTRDAAKTWAQWARSRCSGENTEK